MFLSRKQQCIIAFPTETENSRRLQAETSDNPILKISNFLLNWRKDVVSSGLIYFQESKDFFFNQKIKISAFVFMSTKAAKSVCYAGIPNYDLEIFFHRMIVMITG